MRDRSEILICDHHPEYKVPFISTMAFNGAELWCPYCGRSVGGFDGYGDRVKRTEALVGRLAIYKKHTDYYLHARGKLICAYFEVEGGVKVSRSPRSEGVIEMPKDMETYLQKFVKEDQEGWKYNVKASTLMKMDEKELDMDQFKCHRCEHERAITKIDSLTGEQTVIRERCPDAWKDIPGGHRVFCEKFQFIIKEEKN